jgi:hypothetical protein
MLSYFDITWIHVTVGYGLIQGRIEGEPTEGSDPPFRKRLMLMMHLIQNVNPNTFNGS